MGDGGQHVEIGFDRPLSVESAVEADKLGRKLFAQSAVEALKRVGGTSGFVLSVEGAWGSGKTSTLAMIQSLLQRLSQSPVIVHFNPWLVGDRDALLRHFLSKIATEVKLADHVANGKKVARELKAYAKVFDLVKLIPGAEPWASLVKGVVQSTGEAVDSVASYKTPDIEAKKVSVEDALKKFKRPIIVFIDDIDRLFPVEVFEMVRIIKAVGDLPNVGYVIAWDPAYVADALGAAGVPRSEHYLDKVVQLRLPLPAIGLEARGVLINDALGRLSPEATHPHFQNEQDRLASLYFSGLREMLELPRDMARVFNTVAVIEPVLRGEVVLADIVGLATLMVKAPRLYELMRRQPRWFVGLLPEDRGSFRTSEELIKEGGAARNDAFDACANPNAVRKLVHRLFPLIAKADDEFTIGRVIDVEGHIGAPARFLVALQLNISGADISLVLARRYIVDPGARGTIGRTLSPQNCLEFMQCLGDVVEAAGLSGVSDVPLLCADIAQLVDTPPFINRAKQTELFRLPAEDLALRAIRIVVQAADLRQPSQMAERIVADPKALTVGMLLFVKSFLVDGQDSHTLRCRANVRPSLTRVLAKNVLDAAKTGKVWSTCNPSFLLWSLPLININVCPDVFGAIQTADPSLDCFALAMLSHGVDSVKGQRYALPSDLSRLSAYCAIDRFKSHAQERLGSSRLQLPVRAAWKAAAEDKIVYGVDGSYADR